MSTDILLHDKTISIYEYIERNSSNKELFSAKSEIAIARHTLKGLMSLYNSLIKSYKDINDEEELSLLLTTADRLRRAAGEVITYLKKAAEIDVLQASKFDGLQVIALVNKIPELIVSELENHLRLVCENLSELENPTTREIAIAKITKSITNTLLDRISELSVPGVNINNSDSNGHVTEEEVRLMLGTIGVKE